MLDSTNPPDGGGGSGGKSGMMGSGGALVWDFGPWDYARGRRTVARTKFTYVFCFDNLTRRDQHRSGRNF